MAYLGKEFVLDSQENFDGFINSLGGNLPENVKQGILSHKSTVKLVKNGDKYTLTTGNYSGPSEVTFSPGVEYDEVAHGTPAKSTTTVSGDCFNTVQKFESGTISYKREFSANQLVTTITSSTWDGVAKRIYKA